jgi:hypothetical protein
MTAVKPDSSITSSAHAGKVAWLPQFLKDTPAA